MTTAFNSARTALAAMRDGTLTSEKLISDCLGRIEIREDVVGAWSYLDVDAAMAAARARDGGPCPGPLAGLPIAIKDMFDTADMPTTYGSSIYAEYQPGADAAAVALIRRAGGVAMGKTVSTEFAVFTPGKTANPHDIDHTPGGSSSGSAATVADGMVPLALGTQTAGSIIRPASFCGVVGYKPTFDLISPAGMKDVAWTLDTVGVFARDVHDAALFGEALSGHALSEFGFSSLCAPRIGFCRTPQWMAADTSTQALLIETANRASDAGATITSVSLPAPFDSLLDAQQTIMAYELARTLAFEFDNAADQISMKLKSILLQGRDTSAREYTAARRIQRLCQAQLDTVFADVDALIAPSAPGEAPKKSDGTGDPVFNRIWTLLGTPCVNVPGHSGSQGLPIGIQVIGRPYDDARTLDTAQWLQKLLD